ncbi:hypothetical protein N7466_006780 [Penicillium verhagenii]|uniref:uncharacterized protein n=1 Tax=Penicillium verhagenii TaxID=1562060 RepID=UPI002545B26D|nr:uncharacterized protein N7466_006780 [Penicillium verhagenii]KAJ5927824.1 hypothetical protein N7466_006780 [Penicillium verhagenii]
MQIPTVTIEDLRAFQVQHFPGRESLGASATELEYDEDAGDDEDLGYYPDGVKRTLTDEQIQIFRHSEIHALLRARQLEQDDAEYEARQTSSAKDHNPVAELKPQQKGTVSEVEKSKETTKKEEEDIPATKRSKRPAEHDMSPSSEFQQPSSSKRQQAPNHNPYPGRRIISYDD